jgi:PKD repeat protein
LAKPKTTEEVSALISFFKYNVISTGGESYNLELIFEGRSLNEKIISEAFYSTPDGTRVDVGRRVLGHVDIIPIQFNETDAPIEITLTVNDELGGPETFTRSVDLNNPKLLMFVDAIEYAPNNIVLFSNKFHDPYNLLDGFAGFEIDYGDGTVIQSEGNSFQLTHAYATAGDYTVSITALGDNGESASVTDTITVVGETAPFEFPLADFSVEKAPWAPGVRLYVDQSLSPNAPILTYLWELGDGTTAYGPEVIHFYQAGGYDVTLTAILEDGSQSIVKREVIIMNDAPNMVSNLECWDIGNLTVECEMQGADKFNDLASFNIHFGDTEVIPENIVSQSVTGGFEVINFTHTYAATGNYEVLYQVVSGRGEDLVKSLNVDVTDAPGNQPPVADLACFTFFDQVDCQAYGSFDPDGFITEFKFSFGNGESLTTDTPQTFYTYPEVGTYTVTLEVTDNLGTLRRLPLRS